MAPLVTIIALTGEGAWRPLTFPLAECQQIRVRFIVVLHCVATQLTEIHRCGSFRARFGSGVMRQCHAEASTSGDLIKDISAHITVHFAQSVLA